MTITTVINGVAVGTTASPNSNITKHTCAATTGAFRVQVALTTGAAVNVSSPFRVWYAPCADNLTANVDAVRSLRPGASFVEVTPYTAGIALYKLSPAEMVVGLYVFFWVEEPLLGAAGALTVKISEV
jgi:hypothetical protein